MHSVLLSFVILSPENIINIFFDRVLMLSFQTVFVLARYFRLPSTHKELPYEALLLLLLVVVGCCLLVAGSLCSKLLKYPEPLLKERTWERMHWVRK